LKKRNHNSPPPNAGVDPRALQRAAALLVRAISAELAAGRLPAPQPEKKIRAGRARNLRGAERVIQPTSAPATREEAVKIAARLYTLGCACSELSLPLNIAASWLPLADVAAFADRAEECVRGLLGLFDEYLAVCPEAMKERGLRSTGDITRFDLEGARKQIGRLSRIADGSIGLDIGPHYLPPECRPAGFVEKPYGGPPEGEIVDENEHGGEGDELPS
jgi:hypothetical protein